MPQTHKTMDEYCHIYNLFRKIIILSDSEIKKYYLANAFSNINNTDTIMLIDEFDLILDPMKSNYNIVLEKPNTDSIFELYQLLKPKYDDSFLDIGNYEINH
jgi:hypothetical protein